jgi:hypothetical protein
VKRVKFYMLDSTLFALCFPLEGILLVKADEEPICSMKF